MNSLVEKVLTAVAGGVITASLIAGLPNVFKWLVRPAVPPGAIIAFSRECPDGWDDYKSGGGRFIVGAGDHPNSPHSTYKLGTTGGNETHTLTESEMPSHSHSYYYEKSMGGSCGLSGCNGHMEKTNAVTSEKGEGMPHNNLPPYIALKYCTRGGSL